MSDSTYQGAARRLLANHYLIVPIHPGQKRPMGVNWQNSRVSASDVPRLWSNGAGVGVLCGVGAMPLVAVDIDVHDARVAGLMERWCERNLGATVVRVGRAPKRLLVYRASEAGLKKVKTENWLGNGVEHHVEVLGAGQQFVALGRHPDTGGEYAWIDALGGLEWLEARDVPIVSVGQVSALLDEFARVADGMGWVVSGAGGADKKAAVAGERAGGSEGGVAGEGSATTEHASRSENPSPSVTEGDDPLMAEPILGLSISEIKGWLARLDPDMKREDWIRVIAATKHETKGSSDGYQAVLSWSAQGAKFSGQRDVLDRWKSFKKREGVTFGWVIAKARGTEVEALTDGLVGAPRVKRARTEMGNAERMLDKFGDGLMFVPELRRWYLWTGVYWRKALDVEIEHLAKATILSLREEVELWAEGEERDGFFKFCAASQKAVMVANILRLAASDPRVVVPASELDKDSWLMGARNGVVDIRDGRLLEPDAARRVTLVCGCEFEGSARNALWESTIADVFNDDAGMIAFFQRLVGYTLLGSPEEDVLVIPYGSGSNGKSTLLSVLSRVFGDYAHAAAPETFVMRPGGGGGGQVGPRPDLLALRGARLVWIGEPDEGAELREGFVKSATGGDKIVARAMHSNDILQIVPSWVMWMPTNHKPIVRGDDWAIWRRLMLVPFTRNFDTDPIVTKDPDRDKRLVGSKEALAGILNWCLEGARAYLKHGLAQPSEVAKARSVYRNEMDLLAEWLEECCETGLECRESTAQLWASWEAYARNRGELRMISSARALARRLDSRGFKSTAHSVARGVRGYEGVKTRQMFETEGENV